MRSVRFYEEVRHGVSAGNVVAVFVELRRLDMFDALAAVYDVPNAPVGGTVVQDRYLRRHCRRVPESRARAIHPRLFTQLDHED